MSAISFTPTDSSGMMLFGFTENGRSVYSCRSEELGRPARVRAEQQALLVVDDASIQVRHRHRRCAHCGLPVHLGGVLLDEVELVQRRNAPDTGNPPKPFGLGDTRLLQQVQRTATGTDEHEPGCDGELRRCAGW